MIQSMLRFLYGGKYGSKFVYIYIYTYIYISSFVERTVFLQAIAFILCKKKKNFHLSVSLSLDTLLCSSDLFVHLCHDIYSLDDCYFLISQFVSIY